MKRFHCGHCRNQVFFDNTSCGACTSPLGFDPQTLDMLALTLEGDHWRTSPGGHRVQLCLNSGLGGCNWVFEADGSTFYCRACRHNRTIPNLSMAANPPLWRDFETAKRRLFYALIAFGLPLRTRDENATQGLAFDCVDDVLAPNGDAKRAMTGHDDGVITIALAEADPGRRERARVKLGESYRTLLGHFRHEIGHYYWDLLVEHDGARLAQFRSLFGDERIDYTQALEKHYAQAGGEDWQAEYVTHYAASHPWEDFAETWAHYFHIVDTLDTAHAFDVAVDNELAPAQSRVPFEPYQAGDSQRLLAAWTPLTLALNCLNRSMGQPDLYPFVLPAAAIDKLDFVRSLIADSGARQNPSSGSASPAAVSGVCAERN